VLYHLCLPLCSHNVYREVEVPRIRYSNDASKAESRDEFICTPPSTSMVHQPLISRGYSINTPPNVSGHSSSAKLPSSQHDFVYGDSVVIPGRCAYDPITLALQQSKTMHTYIPTVRARSRLN
jgi:hypothetical protein